MVVFNHALLQNNFIFCLAAGFGSLFFIFKIIFLLLSGCAHILHLDSFDHHHGDHLHDADASFKSWSLMSIAGFIMMFGWSGLAAHEQYGLGMGWSTVIALIVGWLTGWLCTRVINYVLRLASPGAIFNIKASIGKEAIVYHYIPAKGVGKISVVVDDILREVDAVSVDGQEIGSFNKVSVVSIVHEQLVCVKRISL